MQSYSDELLVAARNREEIFVVLRTKTNSIFTPSFSVVRPKFFKLYFTSPSHFVGVSRFNFFHFVQIFFVNYEVLQFILAVNICERLNKTRKRYTFPLVYFLSSSSFFLFLTVSLLHSLILGYLLSYDKLCNILPTKTCSRRYWLQNAVLSLRSRFRFYH